MTAMICSGVILFSSSMAFSSFDIELSAPFCGAILGSDFFLKRVRRVLSVLDVSKLPIYRSVVARLLCPRIFFIAELSAPASCAM